MDKSLKPRQPTIGSGSTTAGSPLSAVPLTSSSDRDQQLEKLLKENKQLKQKVDTLEKENITLKKSIYDLSTHYASAISQGGLQYPSLPYVLDPEVSAQDVITKGQDLINKAVHEAAGSTVDGAPSFTRESKTFEIKYELQGHTGAVYSVEFSPQGKLLASGSFDKTVRVWDTVSGQKEVLCLKSHSLNISDLSWSIDSATLLSGGYDSTCKTWDIESGTLSGSWETKGFVQCLGWDFLNPYVFYYGTSRNVLGMIDVRSATSMHPEKNDVQTYPISADIQLMNDAMMNTLYVSRDGVHVITGDSRGAVKVWDVRARKCVKETIFDHSRNPISHITVGRRMTDATRRSLNDYDEPRYMAINSYDNVLRVCDRGLDPPKSDMRLVHTLKGFKNKNWPIKSSFYTGKEYNASIPNRQNNAVEEKSVLLATGSADPYAYLYNIGENSSELMQRLEGHTDRVYAVNFHPTEPILASCSADSTIKVWGPAVARGKKKGII
ncbi:WD40-repeat-containing domain protein [Umbelopsis sp. PMI_123]|nr:WD40-repeat-containing domain protein [Umbelopsis sp. PMI_123]